MTGRGRSRDAGGRREAPAPACIGAADHAPPRRRSRASGHRTTAGISTAWPGWAGRRRWRWSTPTRRGSCIATSSRATCCWTSAGSSGSPTSAWPRSRAIVGLTITGELLGTLRYASPEQVLARRGIVDHRSDVYSLGATLYELLTLRPPFDGRDRNALIRQIADDEPASPRSLDPSIPVGAGDDRPEGAPQGAGRPLRDGAGAGRRPAAVPRRPADPGPPADARPSGCGPGRGGTRRSSGPASSR